MVNYLGVSDRPYKIQSQVFEFYMPVTCSSFPRRTEAELSFFLSTNCPGHTSFSYASGHSGERVRPYGNFF